MQGGNLYYDEVDLLEGVARDRIPSKTWCFSNQEGKDFKPLNLRHDQTSFTTKSANKVVSFLLLIFVLIFALYIYVVADSSLIKRNSFLVETSLTKEKDCFELFRKNNCTLNKPIGQLCQQLYQCILLPKPANPQRENQTHPEQMKSNSDPKLERIQQILENTLLILGGVGFMGILRKIVKLPSNICQLIGLCGRLICKWSQKIKSITSKKKE